MQASSSIKESDVYHSLRESEAIERMVMLLWTRSHAEHGNEGVNPVTPPPPWQLPRNKFCIYLKFVKVTPRKSTSSLSLSANSQQPTANAY